MGKLKPDAFAITSARVCWLFCFNSYASVGEVKEKVEEEPTQVTEVPPSTRLQGVKETLVLLHPKGVRNRSSCLPQVLRRNAHHQLS